MAPPHGAMARVLAVLAALVVALSSRPAVTDPSEQQLAVVVAKESPINELTFYQLKRLYLGDDMRGPGGSKMIPLNRDSKSPERIGFDKTVLGFTPEAAARYWIDRRIRGQSGPPKVVEPAAVLQRVVARVPFTVAYVLRDEVSAEVKIVRIDGKRPGDSGYPIGIDSAVKAQAFVEEGRDRTERAVEADEQTSAAARPVARASL